MDTPQQYPTMWTTGYIGNVKVSFTFPIRNEMEAYAQAKAITDKLIADGFTTEVPGLELGEERELIVTVMRRAKPKDETVIIDFYTEWGAGTDEPFGTYKYQHLYMDKDKPEMIAEFLKFSGFKSIEDIPLYDGQNPLKRTFGKKHPKETTVPTPFKIVKKQGAEKTGSDGKVFRPWEFVRYETAAAQPKPEAPQPVPPATVPAGEPDYEAEARRKAAAALDNELITIFKADYTSNGIGVHKWKATARVIDGATIPITVYIEDRNAIVKAGYEFPDTFAQNENLAIPVTTELRKGERRIKFIEPLENQPERKWDEDAWTEVKKYAETKGIKAENIKDVLGVDKGGKWTRGYKAAIKEIDKFIGVDFMEVAS